jgi:hypothetical protein
LGDAPGHFPDEMRDEDEAGGGLADDLVHGGQEAVPMYGIQTLARFVEHQQFRFLYHCAGATPLGRK